MNIWNAFKKLLPQDRLRIGTVNSVDTVLKQTQLTDPNGTIFFAKGTSVAAPNKAFVLNGIVQEQAPDLIDGNFIDV